jgi:type IV pilus assembly protein PilN
MRISLNLATRPFTDLGPAIKRLRIGMGVLALLCILFGIGLHFFDTRAAAARAREHAVDMRIEHVQGERQRAEDVMQQPQNAQLLLHAQALNQIFDDKSFSWTLAMEAMETVLPAGVQVTVIEPVREKDGHITVHLRVVGGHDRAVELVRNLEHSRRFLQPRIVNESAETSEGPNKRPEAPSASNRFDFDLFADYNPPTREERIALKSTIKHPSQSSVSKPAQSQAVPLGIRPPNSPNHLSPMQLPGRQPYTGSAPSPNSSSNNAAPTYFRNLSRGTSGGPQ